MFYYKVYDEQDILLGLASSVDFRYFNEKPQMILCCNEKKAQYIRIKEQLYRVYWFCDECNSQKNKYPSAYLKMATREEYEEYIAQLEKENLESK